MRGDFRGCFGIRHLKRIYPFVFFSGNSVQSEHAQFLFYKIYALDCAFFFKLQVVLHHIRALHFDKYSSLVMTNEVPQNGII